MRSSAASTSLAPGRPRPAWAATFNVAATSASRCFEERVQGFREGPRALFQRPPDPLEQLTISRLSFAWPAGRGAAPQRLAHLLKQFLQRPSCLGGRVVDVPVLESLAGVSQDVPGSILMVLGPDA